MPFRLPSLQDTLLHFAAQGAKTATLGWLAQASGIDPTLRNCEGKTARDLAEAASPEHLKAYETAFPFRSAWEENTEPQRRLYITALRGDANDEEDFTRALLHGADINYNGYLGQSYISPKVWCNGLVPGQRCQKTYNFYWHRVPLMGGV